MQSPPAGKTPMRCRAANCRWLKEHMNPYFFISMKDEPEALALLQRELGTLRQNRRLILADREKAFIMAMVNGPGTLFDSLRRFQEREISYAMITHSQEPMPGMTQALEIQRFEFDRKSNSEILASDAEVPGAIKRKIALELKHRFPDFDRKNLDRLLRILWLNNPNYVEASPPRRVAQILQLFQRGNQSGGLYLDLEDMPEGGESRLLFAVGNPPQNNFLFQIMEVFNRLQLGVNRAYCLTISNGIHPYFLGTFYIFHRQGSPLVKEDPLFSTLQQELSITQVLSTESPMYRNFVMQNLISGEDASLVNAFIAFCHTNLSHNQPDRFDESEVKNAFHSHPEMALQLVALFKARFDPNPRLNTSYEMVLAASQRSVHDYNTGHRHLDELRRSIFRCCLLFITHTLKTNFFVLGKQALAFRLDPAYLKELGAEFTADLPQAVPFRITFFFSRFGFGYHMGFSEIARGGWRTIIARNDDDYLAATTTLFRENFVLAHTQHLKNKDIYEGGSKLVVILNASDLTPREQEIETWRLYKLQYGIINAFLDIFITDNGIARDPRVIDYYREDEPIEIGPDENMHDSMVETIAWLSKQRGYLLGIGIISSKKVGINHKEYGVTSTGVVRFAEITMADMGIRMDTYPFSVKITGGPNGDVAGNAMRILLNRCPLMSIRLILDGTAALFDPAGADPTELTRLLLRLDLDAFDPLMLHPGGFMLFRTGSRKNGLKELFRKAIRTAEGVIDEWISVDDFHREFDALPLTVEADLFIPAGGRPETIDNNNWHQYFNGEGSPSARVIIEGANSYITPEARLLLQGKGVVIMRDASANKCGVISSSYEIIANLLLSEQEFLEHKERYVADVLTLLEKRAEDEAKLILKRHHEDPLLPYTEISNAISAEINGNYARIFRYFENHPDLCLQPLFRKAILNHLPLMLRKEPRYRQRLGKLPQKYLFAILAAEIGSSLVYEGDKDEAFADLIKLHLLRTGSSR